MIRFFGALTLPRTIVLWLLIQVLAVGAAVVVERDAIVSAFAAEAMQVKHKMMVKLAQHDTVISALAALSDPSSALAEAGFLRVSNSALHAYAPIKRIQRFYVTTNASSPQLNLEREINADGAALPPSQAYAEAIGSTATQDRETPRKYPLLGSSRYYVLSYRLANQPIAIILTIDGEELLACNQTSNFESILEIGGKIVATQNPHLQTAFNHVTGQTISSFNFGSFGAPFVLRLDLPITFGDVLPWKFIAALMVLSTAVLWVMCSLGVQARVANQLRASERSAKRRLTQLELENRLAYASRINALGELASGIAHELTQPLAAMLSQSQAGLKAYEFGGLKEDVIVRSLHANVREARRAGRILEKMREYVSPQDVKLEICDLNRVVEEVTDLLRAELLKRRIEISVDLAMPPPQALVGKIELEQVVHNLIRNAMEAVEQCPSDKHRILVSTISDLEKNINVISVLDNGPGIHPETFEQIFQPFFTTKSNGLGLGLSLCTKLLEKADGKIEAASDQGAQFKVLLPRLEAAA